MEKGSDSDSLTRFSVFDNKTSSNTDLLASMKLHHSTVTHPFYRHPNHSFVRDDGGAAAGYMYRDQISTENLGKPFDDFHGGYSTSPYKHPGGGMASGYQFTAAQWKELERQAMIYKCMISAVPVPPNLLFSTSFPIDSSVPMYGGRYCRKGDPEPGRCRRTDGKKWRCSREVAPQQKYCERHLHRGRPRSRKPVETNKNSAAENHKKTTKTLPAAKTDLTISTPSNRDLDFSSKQPWQNLGEPSRGLSDYSSPSFDHDYAAAQPLNLFSYPHPPAPEMDLPTGFIDAWSIDHRSKGSVESSISLSEGDLSTSLNLSMAMAVGTGFDEQIGNIPTDDVAWEPFARGGPLGEALQPGVSNPASPYNSIGTAATTVSSPSGVLHWTLFSHSDGSVCNSPTFAAAEISNQWHI